MLFKSIILIKIQFESRLHYIDIIAYHCRKIHSVNNPQKSLTFLLEANNEFKSKNIKVLNKQQILDLKPEIVFITSFESQFESCLHYIDIIAYHCIISKYKEYMDCK